MQKISERTKHLKHCKNWFTFFHLICLFGPLLSFTLFGFLSSTTVGERIALSFTSITTIILALISVIVSATHKTGIHKIMLWVMIIGLMYTLTNIEVFIWIMAIVSILDEAIFSPLMNKFATEVKINKEIDKRME